MQRKWLIALIIGSFAGFCGFVFLITAYYKLFKGDAYYESVAAIQSHPEVIEALGSPIKPSWYFSGNYFFNSLFMQYDISGSKSSGKVFLNISKKENLWALDSVWVIPDNSDEFIIVLERPPIPSGGSCNAPEDYSTDLSPEEREELFYDDN